MAFVRRARDIVYVLVCSAALSIAAAGCGGNSDTQRSAGRRVVTTTKGRVSATPAGPAQRFIAQADALCARTNIEITGARSPWSWRNYWRTPRGTTAARSKPWPPQKSKRMPG
jgi:hypothetical protein